MNKDWKYILYLSIVIGVFVTVTLLSPKEYDWNVSLAHEVKDPYGAYALNTLLPSVFPNQKIHNSYKTLYELKDSLGQKKNIVIFATRFEAGKEDVEVLLTHVESGASVFISAHEFFGKLADTLALTTRDNLFSHGYVNSQKDTASLRFSNPKLDTSRQFNYTRSNIHNYFNKVDSVRATVIAKNDLGQPVTINIPWGSGNLILNCTPMVFTNIYLLSNDNDQFVSGMLSYLPNRNVYWTEYYHLGRMEAGTPLRFILSNEPLSWAYYILIFSIVLFMMFEAKRKQRIIPIIKPLSNTTLEFVATIGNLYYQRSDHKNLAEKKIQYFFDQIRCLYYLNTGNRDEYFILSLAGKSANPTESVRCLINLIEKILSASQVNKVELLTLNIELEKFWKQN